MAMLRLSTSRSSLARIWSIIFELEVHRASEHLVLCLDQLVGSLKLGFEMRMYRILFSIMRTLYYRTSMHLLNCFIPKARVILLI